MLMKGTVQASYFCHILNTVEILRESRTDLHFLRLRRFLPRDISKFSKQTFLPLFSAPPSPQGSTLFHFTKTKQVQNTYLMYVLAFPSGNTYGCFFRKTCPTRLQGMISRLPPHIHTRKEISTRKAASAFCLSVLERARPWCYLSLHPLPHVSGVNQLREGLS